MNSTATDTTQPCTSCGCDSGTCGCGCCEGIHAITPLPTANRPGLSALSARVGTHGAFLETMKARLSSLALPADKTSNSTAANAQTLRPLAGLRTRDAGDPAIALLDAWATVADVLSFYQERITNEGYLRTATERRSLFELSRLLGYKPRPGVAASVYLAYTIDSNTTQEITIPQGSRAQTVPGQDELPQSFETSQDLKARAAWNKLGLRQTVPQQARDIAKSHQLVLAGTQTRLKPGDPLLIQFTQSQRKPKPFRIMSVDADVQADRTTVQIAPWLLGMTLAQWQRQIQSLVAASPAGAKFTKVSKQLNDLIAAEPSQDKVQAALEQVNALRTTSTTSSTALPATASAWLVQAASALESAPIMASAALATSPAPSSSTNTTGGGPADRPTAWVQSRIASLIEPPSKPLANALQLRRSLSANFQPIADAGLKVLSATAPALKDSLSQAISGYDAASPEPAIRVWALRQRAGLFGRGFPRRTSTSTTFSQSTGGSNTTTRTVDDGEWPIVLGQTAADTTHPTELVSQLSLDAVYDGIVAGNSSWVMVDASAVPDFGDGLISVKAASPVLITSVDAVSPKVARAVYGGSGDSTALELADEWIKAIATSSAPSEIPVDNSDTIRNNNFQLIRRTAVYAQSEELTLADMPITADLAQGDASQDSSLPLELDGLYTDLEPGRFAIVSGERTDISGTSGVYASEPVMITAVVHDVRAAGDQALPATLAAAVKLRQSPNSAEAAPADPLPGDRTHTFIWLDKPLAYRYKRATVGIWGNVVKATHGETRNETLGNGDGAKVLQRFDLKQAPLTYLAAATPAGAQDTLSVYVNDVRWQEADGFVDRAPTDKIYLVQTDDKGKTTVQFGNGIEGTRLPTGIGNVRAVYRNGIGRPGNVVAEQIKQLASRPLGVKDVINPLRSSGGADPENTTQVRRNAPLAVKSLERLVSEPDYADFACTFAGIGKADASLLSDGRRSVVHLTVAGTDDIPIDPDSDLMIQLHRALRDLGDPYLPLIVVARELRLLIISAKIRISPDHLWEPVVTQVRTALLTAFGFDRRELAQGVAASEALAVMQAVPGVDLVDLDAFGAIDTIDVASGLPLTPDQTSQAVQAVIHGKPPVSPAIQSARARPNPNGTGLLPAQLVLLSADVPDTLVLNQIKP
ncbi:MAG: putative baseplate assembly protein [Burkholderiales bacterium]|jgi:hypothetical protein|nr:MAG: putative baseplate assembly protein [Burkholderiales bacterium]